MVIKTTVNKIIEKLKNQSKFFLIDKIMLYKLAYFRGV